MSIAKRACHRFQGPLGPSSSGSEVSSCIKVLQTLGMARDRPSPYGNPRTHQDQEVSPTGVHRNMKHPE